MDLMSRRSVLGGALAGMVSPAFATSPAVELTCGMMEAPPWYLPDDPKGGIGVEMLAELASHAGFPIKVVPAPIVRLLMGLKAGQLDMVTFFEMPELEGFARSLGQLGVLDMGVVTRADLHLESAEGLAGRNVGILRGIIRKPLGDRLPSSVNLVEVRDLSLGITMIAGGRLDGMIGTPMALGWHLKQGGVLPGAIGPFFTLWREPLVLYLSTLRHYDEATVRQLQAAMKHTIQSVKRLTEYYWEGAGYESQPEPVGLNRRKSQQP